MALTIICVTGPGSTGKSGTIREFTSKYLKYVKAKGDILGVFPMPGPRYAVGVSGTGDQLDFIIQNRKFLTRYFGLRAMIVASRSEGKTIQEVERFANKAKAVLHLIRTKKLDSAREQNAAIKANVAKIKRLLPR
ncbi:hypothetical protein IVA96_30335 [Bradyrhizobium sp. 159]|uniref:hypothetical protein n=1 Tax=Bradyrhizobium sp. 159 TaxID=2782632 RepID=UPI001FF9674F|nr:hypothetical protein [Bradyrhizobium sp. 159]MCK1620795.1 hypothetical protein [Bradyrhizobium sp. 159]